MLEVTKPLDQTLQMTNQLRLSIVIGTVLMLVLLMGLLIYLFNRVVLVRTRELEQSLGTLAQGKGDLTTSINVGVEDEIGDVANRFNDFIGAFRHLICSIIDTAKHLEHSVNDVREAAHAIQSLITEQESQTSSIATANNEVTASIRDICNNTDNAAANTRKTDVELVNANSQMSQSVNNIDKLNTTMASSVEVITSLGSQSKEIGVVLDVIKSIAEQTNLFGAQCRH